MKVAFVGIVSLLAASAAMAFELVGPKGAATVVLAKDCEPSSRLAAEEFAEYVGKVSGKQVKVEVEGEGGCLSAPRGEGASGTVRIGTLGKFPGEVPAEAKAALAKSKSGEYTIAPNEWVGIQFSNVNATPCDIDDVAVELLK